MIAFILRLLTWLTLKGPKKNPRFGDDEGGNLYEKRVYVYVTYVI